MRITAVGREPLPLTAWSSLRVFLWYFGTQLVVGGILGFFLGLRTGLGSEDAAAGIGDATTQYLIPFAVIGMVVAALVMFTKARQRFPGGSWPTIVAALGWRGAPRRRYRGRHRGRCPACRLLFAGIDQALSPTSRTILWPAQRGGGFGIHIRSNSVCAAGRTLCPAGRRISLPGGAAHRVRQLVGSGPAALIVTILFAVGHLTEVRTYWPALLSISVLAAVTMALRLRTRSLWPGIGMHAGYNAALMATMLLSAG